ncbi:MAG: hypothetical protein ABH821_03615 [archaeon]
MKKLFIVLLLFFLIPLAFAGKVGDVCDYEVYEDTECDIENNIYCVNSYCTLYEESTEEFCTDSDVSNAFPEYFPGNASYLYRTNYGEFMSGELDDFCVSNGQEVSSCDGQDCSVREFNCVPSGDLPYGNTDISCSDGCLSGACVDGTEPTSTINLTGTITSDDYSGSITGTATDSETGVQAVEVKIKRVSDDYYWSGSAWSVTDSWLVASGTTSWSYVFAFSNFFDGNYFLSSRAIDVSGNVQSTLTTSDINVVVEGDTGGEGDSCDYSVNFDSECSENYYCVNDSCTFLADGLSVYCIDSDDLNTENRTVLEYAYRTPTGTLVSGGVVDVCVESGLNEYYCLEDFVVGVTNYDYRFFSCDNCLNGACITEEDLTGLPADALDGVTDSELLNFIELWSNLELATTAEENDSILQEIISIWKES